MFPRTSIQLHVVDVVAGLLCIDMGARKPTDHGEGNHNKESPSPCPQMPVGYIQQQPSSRIV